MRKSTTFLVALVVFVSNYSNAQYADKRKITKKFPIYETDISGKKVLDANDIPDAPLTGSIINVITASIGNLGYLVMEFLDWSKNSIPTDTTLFYKYNYKKSNVANVSTLSSPNNTQKIQLLPDAKKLFFLAKKEDIDSNSYAIQTIGIKSSQFTVSSIIMPTKLRLKNFDFSANVNLGFAAGWRMHLSHKNDNYVNLMLALNIGVTDVDSSTSMKGKDVEVAKNLATFSPAIGMVWEFGKAQAGIFLGYDYLSTFNQNKYQWIYNRQAWISIGFGFSILNQASKASTSNNVDQTVSSTP